MSCKYMMVRQPNVAITIANVAITKQSICNNEEKFICEKIFCSIALQSLYDICYQTTVATHQIYHLQSGVHHLMSLYPSRNFD